MESQISLWLRLMSQHSSLPLSPLLQWSWSHVLICRSGNGWNRDPYSPDGGGLYYITLDFARWWNNSCAKPMRFWFICYRSIAYPILTTTSFQNEASEICIWGMWVAIWESIVRSGLSVEFAGTRRHIQSDSENKAHGDRNRIWLETNK